MAKSKSLSELTLTEADTFLEAVTLTRGIFEMVSLSKFYIHYSIFPAPDLFKGKGEGVKRRNL